MANEPITAPGGAVVVPPAPAQDPKLKAALDELRAIVDTASGPAEIVASLIPVAGADIKIGIAVLKGAVDGADTSVDGGASAVSTILAGLKGALANL